MRFMRCRVDEYTGFLAVLFIIRVFILYLYYFVLFLLSKEEVFRCVLCIIRICIIRIIRYYVFIYPEPTRRVKIGAVRGAAGAGSRRFRAVRIRYAASRSNLSEIGGGGPKWRVCVCAPSLMPSRADGKVPNSPRLGEMRG